MTISDNPFQQSPVTYYVEMQTKYAYIEGFVNSLEEFSTNIVYFEKEGSRSVESMPEDLWQIQAYLEKKTNLIVIKEKIDQAATLQNAPSPEISLHKVDDKDWVSEVQKNFVPIDAEKFFIHSSTYEGEIPANKIIIEMNAGRAFGTGEHETTSNCLRALSEFHLDKSAKCLDVGCGSGILAIAMAKLWQVDVIATDIDEQAVLVTQENCKLNNVTSVKAEQSNGYNSKLLSSNAPYSIITANILASPLIAMAGDAYKHLAPGGILILAGFIREQVVNVRAAHENLGLILEKEIVIQDWPTLIMRKPADLSIDASNYKELIIPAAVAEHDSQLNQAINPWGG